MPKKKEKGVSVLCFIHAAGKSKLCQRGNCQTHLMHNMTESKKAASRAILASYASNEGLQVSDFEIAQLLLTVIAAETPAVLYVIYQMCDFFHCSVGISLILESVIN